MAGRDVLIAAARDVLDCCRHLASFTETPGTTTRTFLSPPMHAVHAHLSAWMTRLAMDVQVDAAGNLRGTRSARSATAPQFIIGSHLDTVPDAGAYDGVLGVAMGIALVELVARQPLPFVVEVVGFSEEEGVRFGMPFIGSRALAGTLDHTLLDRRDGAGITVREAIVGFGLDPSRVPDAVRSGALGYVEFHIEQGPVLEREARSVGVVNAIVGQSRLDVIFSGSSNHAGTTPMSMRHDALAGAAEWIGLVEQTALDGNGLVATVGRVDTAPGATNVIAGRVAATLDVRHPDDHVREATVTALLTGAETIALRRGLTVESTTRLSQPATALDPSLTALMSDAVTRAGLPVRLMTSGAGHDAMVIARCMPAAMLFLRSPGGISHHPDETVLVEDVADALAVGLELLNRLAESSDD